MVTLDQVSVQIGDTATFLFNSVPYVSVTDTYEISKPGEVGKIRVTYIAGTPGSPEMNTGITFIGDTSMGNLSFTLSGIAAGDFGQYVLKNSVGDELQCISLSLLSPLLG